MWRSRLVYRMRGMKWSCMGDGRARTTDNWAAFLWQTLSIG
jgi:hypothetical protein